MADIVTNFARKLIARGNTPRSEMIPGTNVSIEVRQQGPVEIQSDAVGPMAYSQLTVNDAELNFFYENNSLVTQAILFGGGMVNPLVNTYLLQQAINAFALAGIAGLTIFDFVVPVQIQNFNAVTLGKMVGRMKFDNLIYTPAVGGDIQTVLNDKFYAMGAASGTDTQLRTYGSVAVWNKSDSFQFNKVTPWENGFQPTVGSDKILCFNLGAGEKITGRLVYNTGPLIMQP